MRGQTLGQIVDAVRTQCGHSRTAALGRNTQDSLETLANQVQTRLWEDRDWTFLRVDRDVRLNAGQRYYSLPDDMPFERVECVSFRWGSYWNPLEFGVGAREYSLWDSDEDRRAWPVLKWDTAEDVFANENTPLPLQDDKAYIELWPVPAQSTVAAPSLEGAVRVTGIRRLRPFIKREDRADLDDQLISLFTAYEVLTQQADKAADSALARAQRHYRRIKARNSKSEMVRVGLKDKPRTLVVGPPQLPRISRL